MQDVDSLEDNSVPTEVIIDVDTHQKISCAREHSMEHIRPCKEDVRESRRRDRCAMSVQYANHSFLDAAFDNVITAGQDKLQSTLHA
jgi:hypothetical protein